MHRTIKFAKYLPEFGWTPIVLTSDGERGGYPGEADPSLLKQFPREGKIYRVKDLDPLWPLRGFLVRHADPAENGAPTARRNDHMAFQARIIAWFRNKWRTWCYIPDEYIGWLPFALARAVQVTREEGIDIVYSTSDPFTDHLIGYWLKRLTGKPWVADFRDPWTQNAHYRHRGTRRQRVDEWLEKSFLLRADRVVVTAEATRDAFIGKYPMVPAGRMVTITNGYDDDDFPATGTLRDARKARFTIVYTGRFEGEKNCAPAFLHALRQWFNKVPEAATQVVVRFVGLFGPSNEDLVSHLGLAGMVEHYDYLSHGQCVQHLADAHVLLATLSATPGNETIVLGKIFEYLAARKPILALVPDGATAELIRATRSGVVVPPGDVQRITHAVEALYAKHRDGSLRVDHTVSLEHFTRRRLTAKLAELLEEPCP